MIERDHSSRLEFLVWWGAERRLGHDPRDWLEVEHTLPDDDPYVVLHRRIEEELRVIGEAGYPQYFLIVHDLMQYCRETGIPVGPGRGSVCGSMVAYCLYITDVDPIKWDIPFERFLHLERIAMPDIDLDICQARRGDAIEYLRIRYGKSAVAQIMTFGTMQAKAVIQDVCRAKNIEKVVLGQGSTKIARELAGMVPEGSGADQIHLKDWAETEDGAAFASRVRTISEQYCGNPDWLLGQFVVLEAMRRHQSVHAAGVVIGNTDLDQIIPLCRKNRAQIEEQSQYDMWDVEEIGLLKLDVLGLRTVTVLGDAESYIRRQDPDFRIKDVPLDDDATFELLRVGNTKGVFQLEGDSITNAMMGLKPDHFEDIIALLALYRPGPMEQLGSYAKRKHGEEKIKYAHEDLVPVLDKTYGLIVYQEQVMGIARTMAGYTPGEADVFRKAIGKKIPELIAEEIAKFSVRAVDRGYDATVVGDIGDQIAYFGRYGFNRGHATGYGFITYWTAYLKANYPTEFFAATFNSLGSTDRISLFVRDALNNDVRILTPDINRSGERFTIDGPGRILFGLGGVKGVGDVNVADILEERDSDEKNLYTRKPEIRTKDDGTEYKASIKHTERGPNNPRPYDGFIDLCSRLTGVPIDKKKALIKAGAFDSFVDGMEGRGRLLEQANDLNKEAKKGKPNLKSIPDPISIPPEVELLSMEKDTLGFYVTRHPLDVHLPLLEMWGATVEGEFERVGSRPTIAGIVMEIRTHKSKRGEMAWVTLETGITNLPQITMFNDVWKGLDVEEGDIIIVDGKKDKHPKFGWGVIAQSAIKFDPARNRARQILVTIKDADVDDLMELQGFIDEEKKTNLLVGIDCGGNRLALVRTDGYIYPVKRALLDLRKNGWDVRLDVSHTASKIPCGGVRCRRSKDMHKGSGPNRLATWELPMAKLATRLLGGKVVAEYEIP